MSAKYLLTVERAGEPSGDPVPLDRYTVAPVYPGSPAAAGALMEPGVHVNGRRHGHPAVDLYAPPGDAIRVTTPEGREVALYQVDPATTDTSNTSESERR